MVRPTDPFRSTLHTASRRTERLELAHRGVCIPRSLFLPRVAKVSHVGACLLGHRGEALSAKTILRYRLVRAILGSA